MVRVGMIESGEHRLCYKIEAQHLAKGERSDPSFVFTSRDRCLAMAPFRPEMSSNYTMPHNGLGSGFLSGFASTSSGSIPT